MSEFIEYHCVDTVCQRRRLKIGHYAQREMKQRLTRTVGHVSALRLARSRLR